MDHLELYFEKSNQMKGVLIDFQNKQYLKMF